MRFKMICLLAAISTVGTGGLEMKAFGQTPAPAPAQAPTPAGATKPLVNFGEEGLENGFKPTSAQVTFARSKDAAKAGIEVTIEPGKDQYPGFNIKPSGASVWDLSAFGHIDARVVNTGSKTLNLAMRVDNPGDWRESPWNTESVSVKPGSSATVTVIFGHSYGKKPGYALKPEKVANVLLFATKESETQSFRVESLVAGGPAGEKPPVDPKSIRIKPKDGVMLGGGVAVDEAKQIDAKNTQGWIDTTGGTKALMARFTTTTGGPTVMFKPEAGRWDLRDALEVRVKIKNMGKAPVTPKVRLESNGGPTDWVTSGTPIEPGQEREVAAGFASAKIWTGEKDTGNKFTSDAASGVTIGMEQATGENTLRIESIVAGLPKTPEMPDWLGKRPPVEGEWVQTFSEEFDGKEIDASKWNVKGENYYDKKSHWSKDNVIVGDGVARLRYEKKTGHHNDDPTRAKTDYATGFLDTYGKWVQRYGYYEARMKLPTAPGLWPSFWMMPDRGVAAGPQWKRASTENGAMEMDIMEALTRWGPYRYNIAMHYDGYDKNHKMTGTDKIYAQPDKDGFITCGMLWTPGSLVYYCNGKPVLKWEKERVSNVPSNMIFTLPMGGWDNNALDDKQLPADFVVDYVRVWQRKDLASDVDGVQKPAAATQGAKP